jgi:hypothetical protein
MHAEKISMALLLGNAALTAVVPTTSIYPHIVAQAVPLPALSVTFIDAIELPTIDAAAYALKQARMSIEIHASDYPSLKTIGALVRTAMRYQRGVIAGVPVASIVGAGDGPDLRDDDPPIYRQSLDFLVTFTEN